MKRDLFKIITMHNSLVQTVPASSYLDIILATNNIGNTG